jgi:hypothetical protein
VCVSKKEEKPNGVYFEIRKKNEDEEKKKSKLNRALFLFYTQKRESNFIDFVDDNRLFFLSFFGFFYSKAESTTATNSMKVKCCM